MVTTGSSFSTATSSPEARAFLRRAREVLQQFAVLIRNAYLHDLSNEVFEDPLEKTQVALAHILTMEKSFRLERSGQEFYANGVRLRMEIRTLHAYKYVWGELDKRCLGGVQFVPTPSTGSLSGFLKALLEIRSAAENSHELVNSLLSKQGVSQIEALPPRPDEEDALDEESIGNRRQRAIDTYQQTLDFIRESMANLDSPADVNLRRAKRSIQKLVDLSYEEGDGFSLAGMAAIKDHDNYTFNHMVNVCILAIAFGQRLGLPKQDLAQLGLCALYHDMGKLHIPLVVLNKHASLSEKEWAVMGNHTIYAARELFPLIKEDYSTIKRIFTALQHHLGQDGQGYPSFRVRKRQSLYARITAIVDTFDAMTTRRIYQKQFLPDECITLIHERSGTRYDPLLVKAFINCMGMFPVGSTVLLTSGELAIVVESNPDPERIHQPKVKVVTDAEKRLQDTVLIDLSQPDSSGRTIIKCVDPEQFGINSVHYVV